MSRMIGAMAALSLMLPAAADCQTAVPPRLGVVAPKLSALSSDESRAALATPRHCEMRTGSGLLLVATEQGRQAIVKVNGAVAPVRYEGRNPVRNGGRFLPSSGRFDLWISVKPQEDKSLPTGAPRHVTVMINGADGGSDVFQALYSCNY